MVDSNLPILTPTPVVSSDANLNRDVIHAFLNYQSTLHLSHSPLSDARIVRPTLIRDPLSPNSEDRAAGLRLLLRWAVNKLAPEPAKHPIGVYRPLDDPTWSNPHWWKYNILRHRYIDIIHPDNFIDGGRHTRTLIALTGIPSQATFSREQSRAVQEVAGWIKRQIQDREADAELQQLALNEVLHFLSGIPNGTEVMRIASVFSSVFPRTLLVDLAKVDNVINPEITIDELIGRGYLLSSGALTELWISPVLKGFMSANLKAKKVELWHKHIATHYLDSSCPLTAAFHFQEAGMHQSAAAVVLDTAPALTAEMKIDQLRNIIYRFKPRQLDEILWFRIQLLLSDLCRMVGEIASGIVACRAAFTENLDDRYRGMIYHRLGRLYEKLNPSYSMTYYQHALAHLTQPGPERAELLKDRAWQFIFQNEPDKAMTDLCHSLTYLNPGKDSIALFGDIYDAISAAYKRKRKYDLALRYAREALSIRETTGHPFFLAKSHSNMAWIYYETKKFDSAAAAFTEAADTFRRLNNQRYLLDMMINIGIVHHASGALLDALDVYRDCYRSSMDLKDNQKIIIVKINLAEILAELEETDEAIMHWKDAYRLSLIHNFTAEAAYLENLRKRFPLLQTIDLSEYRQHSVANGHSLSENGMIEDASTNINYEEAMIVEIAKTHGYVSTGLVIEHIPISRATATRKLNAMVEKKALLKYGRGRGTRYKLEEPDFPIARAESDETTQASALKEKFRDYATILKQRYYLGELFIVDSSDYTPRYLIPSTLNLVAVFVQMPELSSFFELSEFLSEMSGQQVNVIPQSIISTWDRDILMSRAHRILP